MGTTKIWGARAVLGVPLLVSPASTLRTVQRARRDCTSTLEPASLTVRPSPLTTTSTIPLSPASRAAPLLTSASQAPESVRTPVQAGTSATPPRAAARLAPLAAMPVPVVSAVPASPSMCLCRNTTPAR